MASGPLTSTDYWESLRTLTKRLERDLEDVYASQGVTDLRPRYVPALLALGASQPLTITELAASSAVTHSAMSQTVSSLQRVQYVALENGSDGRTRLVHLTAKGKEVLSIVQAEWTATEAALQEIDSELPYSFQQVVRDLDAATSRLSLRNRVLARMHRVVNESDED
ncbi:MarR family winged helix-turn-helix transcriptional regulator [Curtobacterium flaccumfaciens]|uniref:MarR family winged helix-turn-helix transcriptional regulator n=1 Tax=Curtobacterium flaccumfaciens TaxID=2035 RepID=UPI001BDDD537|nr:MarR family winged helix-turn-helix transcriptional regulator [Curtobacterium flaccumfaciens]MBT1672835.1 MarR family winged helix-turn-helix transcriptional regulator [Curtobacterium flaccumfaciens pv. flaccumfaciens]